MGGQVTASPTRDGLAVTLSPGSLLHSYLCESTPWAEGARVLC